MIAFAKCDTVYILFHNLEPVLVATPAVESAKVAAEVAGNRFLIGSFYNVFLNFNYLL
jgi:hypothetical protein